MTLNQSARPPKSQGAATTSLGNVNDETYDGALPESTLVGAVDRMLGRAEYLLPLVGAQRQYRAVHYGLTAAALLEDVFTDAVSFYVRQFEPHHLFERSARGEAEVDYLWDDQPISHKSGLGPTAISVLWDATVENKGGWTSRFPVAYLSTGYHPTNGAAVLADGTNIEVTSTFRDKGMPPIRVQKDGTLGGRGQQAIVVRWPVSGPAEVLLSREITPDHEDISDVFSFEEIWQVVTRETFKGVPANRIELLRTRRKPSGSEAANLSEGALLEIDFALRSGFYLIPLTAMRDVPLSRNNRGQLLAKETVVSLLKASCEGQLFAPMPLWFAHHAPERPPDTFLPLRAELDNRFSSTRRG